MFICTIIFELTTFIDIPLAIFGVSFVADFDRFAISQVFTLVPEVFPSAFLLVFTEPKLVKTTDLVFHFHVFLNYAEL